MEHQKEAGVFTTVSTLVDNLTDNPRKAHAQEILARHGRNNRGLRQRRKLRCRALANSRTDPFRKPEPI